MKERKEKLTGTSTKTAFSATFRVSVILSEQPLGAPCAQDGAQGNRDRWEDVLGTDTDFT